MKRYLIALALAACTEHKPAITGTQSLDIALTSPSNPGTLDNRIDTAVVKTVSATIKAIGPDGQLDTTFDHPLQVYVHYLGTLTPYIGQKPLATVVMSGGMGTLTNFALPPVFGPTTLWFEDACYTTGVGEGSQSAGCVTTNPTYATGSSPTLWFRDPFIADVRRPLDETSPKAFAEGPVDDKNISIRASRFGANGRLVVTSKFAQGYTVADVKCADANGSSPCGFAPQPDGIVGYDSVEVFSFSAPLDQFKRFVQEAQAIDGFAGGVSEFNGLLEIGFPQTFVDCETNTPGCPDVDPAREPAPVVADFSWFNNPILFKRYEAAAIEIDNAKVCNLDSSYDTYKQWKLDLSGTGGDCSGLNFINVVSAGILDPKEMNLPGKTIPKIVGIARGVPAFKIWIIYPRSLSDITLP